MLKYCAYLLIIFMPLTAFSSSNCNFSTGQHISDLQNPSKIELIEIITPKSSKYAKNSLKVALSKSGYIAPSLKKVFKADIKVHYNFGECLFKGKIRQSGKWKDHIQFLEHGNLIRSLDVKLNNGNILSSVRFKLLIPDTRNSEHEILATLILKNLGIISPITFSIKTRINGLTALMLFQENAQKEMLERNFRRESAIFEGDEELLFEYESFNAFYLELLALARMKNNKWLQKGDSSQLISISAFSELQSAYWEYAFNSLGKKNGLIIHPNPKKNPRFSEFSFLLLAMNAGHGMRPHNRRFYYNTISQEFEPIYYDGNANFKRLRNSFLGNSLSHLISKQFNYYPNNDFISNVLQVVQSEKLKSDFIDHSRHLKIDTNRFYTESIAQYSKNVRSLATAIKNQFKKSEDSSDFKPSIKTYINRMKNTKFSQLVVTELKKDKSGYIATFANNKVKHLNLKEVENLISKNRYNGQRAIFLGSFKTSKKIQPNQIVIPGISGEIFVSQGIRVLVSTKEKEISFIQNNHDDWVLIKNAKLNGWSIEFDGAMRAKKEKNIMEQRYNSYGLTGCLTIYKSTIYAKTIRVNGGGCEDSLNIVSSDGEIGLLEISNAYADGVDIDFSSIFINETNVSNAGNDCIDLSGGSYHIETTVLKNCGDKGISAGEKSHLKSLEVQLYTAEIGISSKDYSHVNVINAQMYNVKVCIEAKQKKQEFGGAHVTNANLDCKGTVEVDKNSIFNEVLQ